MDGPVPADAPDGQESPPSEPKPRRCLRCRGPFQSAWAGERICPRCKSSNAWRTGMPASFASNGDGR
jgi:hypothetical protein